MEKTTHKYDRMLQAFACDFWLATEGGYKIAELQRMIENNNESLLEDIDLLNELTYNIRCGRIKIVEIIDE